MGGADASFLSSSFFNASDAHPVQTSFQEADRSVQLPAEGRDDSRNPQQQGRLYFL